MGKPSNCGGPDPAGSRASQEQGSGAPDSHLEDASGTTATKCYRIVPGLTSGQRPLFVTFGLILEGASSFSVRDALPFGNALRSSRALHARRSAITQEGAC